MNRPVVLVVDDEKDFLESVGEILRDAGFDVDLASSAPQALEFASRRRPSAMVLDIAMPGVDGIQLLRYFRSRHVFRQVPVVLLSAGIRKEALRDALDMGVKDVLLKTKFTPPELVQHIRQRLSVSPLDMQRATESVGHAPESAPAEARPAPSASGDGKATPPSPQMIEGIGRMRALPKVVADLLRLTSQPETSVPEMEAVLRGDPVVTARVLQAANTAAVARTSGGAMLEEAIRTLGFSNIAKIASSGSLLTEEDMNGSVGSDLRSLWRHCLAAATYAERMAAGQDRSAAYLSGLLHDLPSLFALQYLGNDWLPWRTQAGMKGIPLHEALGEALGCSLESLAPRILEAYRIPGEVAGPVLEYHQFFLATKPQQPGTFARRLDQAHHFAAATGRPGTEFSAIRSIYVEELRPFSAADILRYTDERGHSHHEQESGLGEPSTLDELPEVEGGVCLWRDPRWASPDPVETVVAGMCDCLRVERIDELAQPGRRRIAMAEPGSPEWSRLGQFAPLVVLHRAALPDSPLDAGVDALRMPLSIARLANALRRLHGKN